MAASGMNLGVILPAASRVVLRVMLAASSVVLRAMLAASRVVLGAMVATFHLLDRCVPPSMVAATS
jgi:hypothetical protein